MKDTTSMTEGNYNTTVNYMHSFIFALIIAIEIGNLISHTKMVNKIRELSDKVGIECNVKTNELLFTTTKLK